MKKTLLLIEIKLPFNQLDFHDNYKRSLRYSHDYISYSTWINLMINKKSNEKNIITN